MKLDKKSHAVDIKNAARALKSGSLVAFPTETVYGLGADALNRGAISRLYSVKGRPLGHPVIVHISSWSRVELWASEIPHYAYEMGKQFWPGPLTLVLRRQFLAEDFITGGQENVALRVPSHPIAMELILEFEKLGGLGVAAPSANRFGKVSPTTALAVEAELGELLNDSDQILDGGPSIIGVESTIIDCTNATPLILRPGGITIEMFETALGIRLDYVSNSSQEIKVPGSLKSHYSPSAEVLLSGTPGPGDGYIAMADIPTPKGVIRLATPNDLEEYAHSLYEALRTADIQGLKKVFVVQPDYQGVGVAINDRLIKSAGK
jgi:L-threonylcarbamoyladenylate synthase